MARTPESPSPQAAYNRAFKRQLNRVYRWYTLGFLLFVVLLSAYLMLTRYAA